MIIDVLPSGQLMFIYDDELREIIEHGESVMKRVSHVEPDEDANFTADLSPIGGPVLGPFRLRQEALKWLESHVL